MLYQVIVGFIDESNHILPARNIVGLEQQPAGSAYKSGSVLIVTTAAYRTAIPSTSRDVILSGTYHIYCIPRKQWPEAWRLLVLWRGQEYSSNLNGLSLKFNAIN